MLHTDIKYLHLASPHLQRFKRKSNFAFNFRCPFCGDSKKSKTKARGYVYRKKNDLFYTCHNCGKSTNLYGLLQHLDSGLAKEYQLERYREGHNGSSNVSLKGVEETIKKDFFGEVVASKKDPLTVKFFSLMDCIKNLPDNNPAVAYCIERKIPRSKWGRLFYVSDSTKLVELDHAYEDKVRDKKPRLVIPYFDKGGKIFALTARSLDPKEDLRYFTMKFNELVPLIYGTDRYKPEKKGFVTEGPIDSLFLPNCLAASGTDFPRVFEMVPKSSTTFLFDNQPRKPEVCAHIKKVVDGGWPVCFWPHKIMEKDINEMIVKGGMTRKDILRIIYENTYSGLEARLEYSRWAKS